jgi:hypothetical protein
MIMVPTRQNVAQSEQQWTGVVTGILIMANLFNLSRGLPPFSKLIDNDGQLWIWNSKTPADDSFSHKKR